jgi:nitrate reductase gamma subunit
VTVAFAILLYAAVTVMAIGLAVKIHRYATVPAPLKIPTTPAPTTTSGVVLRMAREVVLFESLFRSNKWIWLFGSTPPCWWLCSGICGISPSRFGSGW